MGLSGLVVAGPAGAYVITVMAPGLTGDAGWQLIAEFSASVLEFEAQRI